MGEDHKYFEITFGRFLEFFIFFNYIILANVE
jgi:hypothetical protein